jgi:hypothetical protein
MLNENNIMHVIRHFIDIIQKLKLLSHDDITLVEDFLNNKIDTHASNSIINDSIIPNTSSNIIHPLDFNTIIEDKPNDEIIQIAYLRNHSFEYNQTMIKYKNDKYYFDAVYSNDLNLMDQIYNFTEKRITNKISSTILLYAYSNSGKSTLLYNLLKTKYNDCMFFKLYAVSHEGVYAYFHSTRVPIHNINVLNDKAYIFISDSENIKLILNNFIKVQKTNANTNSSREHIILECLYKINDQYISVKIVDLCGNEKISNDKSNKIIEAQTKYINKSLYSITSLLANQNYKNNKCNLFNFISKSKNIVLILILHDQPEIKLFSKNILKMFNNCLKKKN